ncbi:MAG: hypothetical protein Q8R15_04110 [Candidatus Micrarchaeota archaeon]|nr:hypothetical protein [Candidatus Micrarchaeota archaeon]
MEDKNIYETLDEIHNYLRKHEGKITGKELQPALEMLKAHFEQHFPMTLEEKKAFDLLFEKLSYHDNGKGAFPALAFLLAAVEFNKIGKLDTLKKIGEYAKRLVKELTPRVWEYQEIVLAPLQKINNACRDVESFLNPRITKTYEYEIKASTMTENEKQMLLEEIKKIAEK